jgi:glutamyl-tRNA synthetase
MLEVADGAVFYYTPELVYDAEAIAKNVKPETTGYLQELLAALSAAADFKHDGIEAVFKEVCAELGIKMGQIGPAVRIALSGGTVSPSIYEVMEVLGKEETCRRLNAAITRFAGL